MISRLCAIRFMGYAAAREQANKPRKNILPRILGFTAGAGLIGYGSYWYFLTQTLLGNTMQGKLDEVKKIHAQSPAEFGTDRKGPKWSQQVLTVSSHYTYHMNDS